MLSRGRSGYPSLDRARPRCYRQCAVRHCHGAAFFQNPKRLGEETPARFCLIAREGAVSDAHCPFGIIEATALLRCIVRENAVGNRSLDSADRRGKD
jgi:hypothetical protein